MRSSLFTVQTVLSIPLWRRMIMRRRQPDGRAVHIQRHTMIHSGRRHQRSQNNNFKII